MGITVSNNRVVLIPFVSSAPNVAADWYEN